MLGGGFFPLRATLGVLRWRLPAPECVAQWAAENGLELLGSQGDFTVFGLPCRISDPSAVEFSYPETLPDGTKVSRGWIRIVVPAHCRRQTDQTTTEVVVGRAPGTTALDLRQPTAVASGDAGGVVSEVPVAPLDFVVLRDAAVQTRREGGADDHLIEATAGRISFGPGVVRVGFSSTRLGNRRIVRGSPDQIDRELGNTPPWWVRSAVDALLTGGYASPAALS